MKKQYAWDQVDRLAEEWYATPAGEEHAAIKQKLLEEFLGLSCNLLSESMMEGLGDFWEQDFQRFDPALTSSPVNYEKYALHNSHFLLYMFMCK